jgi:hypothetical protein
MGNNNDEENEMSLTLYFEPMRAEAAEDIRQALRLDKPEGPPWSDVLREEKQADFGF